MPVPGRDRGWNISLFGEGKQVQVKSPATEAPSGCYDPPKSRFFPIKIFFLRQGGQLHDGHEKKSPFLEGKNLENCFFKPIE